MMGVCSMVDWVTAWQQAAESYDNERWELLKSIRKNPITTALDFFAFREQFERLDRRVVYARERSATAQRWNTVRTVFVYA